MNDFFSKPYWDGVSGIVGIVSLALAILYDYRKRGHEGTPGITWRTFFVRFLAAIGGSLGAGLALAVLEYFNIIQLQEYVTFGILLGAPAGVLASVVLDDEYDMGATLKL